jgi:hypothetical protein
VEAGTVTTSPCPRHDRIVELEEQLKFFNKNTFEGFDHCGYSFKMTSLIKSINIFYILWEIAAE